MTVVFGGDAACTHTPGPGRSPLCQNRYWAGGNFYRTHWNLTEVPSDIPAEARAVYLAATSSHPSQLESSAIFPLASILISQSTAFHLLTEKPLWGWKGFGT